VSEHALLTANEVALLLNVPASWVREHTREGHIPHVRLGRYVRYQRASVIAWVESLSGGGGPAFRKHAPRLA
jgi:excisionase family DNA binding protein